MSKEKIAAIRVKRLAKKRATIKDDDIDRTAVTTILMYFYYYVKH